MTDSVYTYIKSNVELYLLDPPDTDFQHVYLAALLDVASRHWACTSASLRSRRRKS